MSLCSVFQKREVISLADHFHYDQTSVGVHVVPLPCVRCALHVYSLRQCCGTASFLPDDIRWLRFQAGRERPSRGGIVSFEIGLLSPSCSVQLKALVHSAISQLGRVRVFGGHCSTTDSQRDSSIRVHRCELDNEKAIHRSIDVHRRERASVRGQHDHHEEDSVPL